jgi:DNA-binding transcriptional MerR regulator
MRSGQLAHLTGVSTDTLRHYERLGFCPCHNARREITATILRRLSKGSNSFNGH